MSTILDALRKLQGDRDQLQQAQARDLRSSVLDSASLPPLRTKPVRSEQSVRPLIAALGGGSVVAACAIGLFVYTSFRSVDSYESPSPAENDQLYDATQLAQLSTPPPPPPRVVVVDPPALVPLSGMASPPEPSPDTSVSPGARYVPPAFQQPEPVQEVPVSNQPYFAPPETFPSPLDRARPIDGDPSIPPSDSAYPPPPPKYDPPQVVTRTASQRPAEPAALESALTRARERLERSDSGQAARPRREARAEAPSPRSTSEPEPERPRDAPAAVTTGVQFPVVEVQSVLWHPDPTRRQATILLDGQLTTDAREGDLIGGVFIDRIEPGSVEFRMGQERKRVAMAP